MLFWDPVGEADPLPHPSLRLPSQLSLRSRPPSPPPLLLTRSPASRLLLQSSIGDWGGEEGEGSR